MDVGALSWRLGRTAATVLMVAVALWAVSDASAPVVIVVVEAPAAGEALAQQLPDGTPVWVTTDASGVVTVLEAFTPTTGRIGGLVGHCETDGRFIDPHLGVSFAPDGVRYRGRIPGRMPPRSDPLRGLTPRPVVLAGPAQPGAPVRVDGPGAPGPGLGPVSLFGEQGHGPPLTCRLADRRLPPHAGPGDIDAVADHAHLATTLRPERPGWQVADGWLLITAEGDARWCDGSVAQADVEACDDRRQVPVVLPLDPAVTGRVVTALGSPLLAHVEDGAITQAAVLPSSTWVGSSLVATRTMRLHLIGPDPTGSRLLVRSTERSACVTLAPAMPLARPGTSVVYLDVDTAVPVGPREGTAEVTVDLVTCRALAVRQAG